MELLIWVSVFACYGASFCTVSPSVCLDIFYCLLLFLQSFVSSYLRDILKEYGCRGNLPHVLEYANKCVEITWLMSVQDPPVILDNMKDHHGFHTEMYKAFTKHGRNVDFYVWPALLLHEGGPLLAKGVAQGN